MAFVVIYHMGLPLSGGFTGVDMFFVISGYVIMESLCREYDRSGGFRFGAFFLRRFKRLFPALLVLVAVTLVLSTVFLPPLADENRALLTGIGAIFISANLVIGLTTGDYFDADARLNPLLHTWSLSVEEQFYLFFPLVVLLALWWAKRRTGVFRNLFIIMSMVTVVSFAAAIIGSRVDLPVGSLLVGFYSPIPRAWEFGAGVLLSLALRNQRPPGILVARISGWAGAALLGAGAMLITSETPFPGEWALLPVVGAALLIYAGSGNHRGVVTQALSMKPLVWLGDVSYSLYLWHWPLIVFMTVAVSDSTALLGIAVAVSLGLSWLSYRFIEEPLRHRPTPTARSIAFYVLAVVAIPGAVIFATWFLTFRYLVPFVENIAGSPMKESTAVDNRCLSSTRFDDAWALRCTWFPDAGGSPVYLIGDSTATHLGEGLILAGQELNRPVKIWNGILCIPFPGMQVTKEDGRVDRRHCPEYQEFVDSRLHEGKPGTVILGFSDIPQHSDELNYSLVDGTVASGKSAKGRALEEPLVDYVQLLASWGHEVVIAYPVPNFRSVGPGYNPRMCSLWELIDDTCAPRVDREDMLDLQNEMRYSVNAAATRTGASTIDLFDRYCDEAICTPSRNRLLVYHDDTHISKDESALLAPDFIALLESK